MALEHHLDTPLARAIRAVGTQSGFARLIGRSQSTVWTWLDTDFPLPAEYCVAVEQATGIPRHELRPDVFPAPESAPAVSA